MNKFQKSKSINKKMFLLNEPATVLPIIAKHSEPLEPIMDEKIDLQIPLQREITKTIIEVVPPEEKTLNIINDKDEGEAHNIKLCFSEIYKENVEAIPEKNEIKLTKMKSLKLVVDEVLLNLKKNKKNGWNC